MLGRVARQLLMKNLMTCPGQINSLPQVELEPGSLSGDLLEFDHDTLNRSAPGPMAGSIIILFLCNIKLKKIFYLVC